MVTLREFLAGVAESCPEWLSALRPDERVHPAMILRHFMASRIVYYPGSGYDGDPVAAFNASRAAHCFVYVDYLTAQTALRDELQHRGFRDYASILTVDLQEADFGIGAWVPHVRAPVRYPFTPVQPYGFLEIFERKPERGADHGANRFAVLFMAADGYASYDAMFCQEQSHSPPFCVVLQDHGFGGGFSSFGRGGILEDIAIGTHRLPKLLLAAENTSPWVGYERCASRDGTMVEGESQGGRMRALWALEAREFLG